MTPPMETPRDACECGDPLCPVHGMTDCDKKAEAHLFRIDTEDEDGTMFCEACAEDAMRTGLFIDKPKC